MSTRSHASVHIALSAEKVWEAVRKFDFPGHLISSVASVEIEGAAAPTAVGAVRKVTWKTGETQSHRLLALDDQFRTARWELVEAEPAAEVSAVMSTLRVFRITEDETSVLDWQAEFSADATGDFVVFNQKAQLESLREIRSALTSGSGAASSS